MEYVPQSYIARLKITPCIDGGEVSFGNVKLQTPPYVDVVVTREGKPSAVDSVTAKASFGGKEVASAAGKVCGKYVAEITGRDSYVDHLSGLYDAGRHEL